MFKSSLIITTIITSIYFNIPTASSSCEPSVIDYYNVELKITKCADTKKNKKIR